jgi:hypothetical protein
VRYEVEMIDVEAWGKELDIENLALGLRRRGIDVVAQDAKQLTLAATKRRIDREALLCWLGQDGAHDAPADPLSPNPSELPSLRFKSRWNERRSALLARHPWLERLVDDFVNYVLELESEARVEQHGQTVTFIMPRGRRAGLRLRTGGVWLAARRNGVEITEWVRSETDFERGLAWLKNLPDY